MDEMSDQELEDLKRRAVASSPRSSALEFVLGQKRAELLKGFDGKSAAHAMVERRLTERSVIVHFYDFLEQRGVGIPAPLRARDVTLPAVPNEDASVIGRRGPRPAV